MKRLGNTATRAAWSLGAALIALVAIVSFRTLLYQTSDQDVEPVALVPVNQGAAERLAESITFATISGEDPATFDANAFDGIHAFLLAAFPGVRSELVRETVAEHSVLYTWRGADPSLRPILFMGHLDVVPIETATAGDWQEPPFAGRILEGYIWGRGAIDNKSTVVGLLEAAEMLIAEGFRPNRTIHFAFGHDEEVGGRGGAERIAELLRSRGVELEMVLDEGGVISDGVLQGISRPVALVGIAEKGFATIELTTRTQGGHSSMPPPQSAVGIIGAAVVRLEAQQMRARLDGATRQLFDHVGPELPLGQRAAFANLWLTRPLVLRQLETAPNTNAMIRTTTAVTVIEGGTKDNVLPSTARALVNYRILPGDSVQTVLEHARRTVDDPRVEIRVAGRFRAEPSSISSNGAQSFRRLSAAIRRTTPDALVAPYLVVVVTDSRYFADISENTYRFSPVRLSTEDLATIHGVNERLSVEDYEHAIRTYRQIMIDVAGS